MNYDGAKTFFSNTLCLEQNKKRTHTFQKNALKSSLITVYKSPFCYGFFLFTYIVEYVNFEKVKDIVFEFLFYIFLCCSCVSYALCFGHSKLFSPFNITNMQTQRRLTITYINGALCS